jgi:hypothetical protein
VDEQVEITLHTGAGPSRVTPDGACGRLNSVHVVADALSDLRDSNYILMDLMYKL